MKNVKIEDRDVNIFTLKELEDVDFTKEAYKEYLEDYDALNVTLYVSISVNMWRFCHINDSMSIEELINIMSSDKDWYKKYYWTPEQRADYEHILVPIFMKWFSLDKSMAWKTVSLWSGFGSAFSFKSKERDVFDHYLTLVEDLNKLENEFILDVDVEKSNLVQK